MQAGKALSVAPLARRLSRYAPADGAHPLPYPGAYVYRISRREEIRLALYEPAICLVAQGAKAVFYRGKAVRYDPLHFLATTVDLPLRAEVLDASPERPFLCLKLVLEPAEVADLVAQTYPEGLPAEPSAPVCTLPATPELVDAVRRFLDALGDPKRRTTLAPLFRREILIRLLLHDPALARFAMPDSHLFRIGRAVEHLRAHFREPLDVEALARLANLSKSAFYHHFKLVTSLTPLQYLKALRLEEARRLLLAGASVTRAALEVGYASPSQFVREYRRVFGKPPLQDVAELRSRYRSSTPNRGGRVHRRAIASRVERSAGG